MKASFFDRLGAYFLDSIIISIIFSIICLGFGNYKSSAEKKIKELDSALIEEKITSEEYLDKYTEALYEYQKDNTLKSGISIALTIAYFLIFQYMNKGQTIGKKLLKIKVVDKDTEKPISILRGLLRSFIILSMTSSILCIALVYILNKKTYFITNTLLVSLEGIFTLITVILVLYRKDGRGLHDMMANTKVIKESR